MSESASLTLENRDVLVTMQNESILAVVENENVLATLEKSALATVVTMRIILNPSGMGEMVTR